MLKVSRQPDGHPEIFYSIQGEGVNMGRPAVFLRLSLCNLACTWCDTKYTWDWEQYDPKEQIVEMSAKEIEREILRYNCKHLVITGGEPMIQHRQLTPLLKCLKNKEFQIEIETNGTIVPTPGFANLIEHWSVSPKLESSGNPLSSRENPKSYQFFGNLPFSHFKYVIEKEDDLAEVQNIVQKYNLPRQKIILMPQAKDRETLLKQSRWLVEVCKSQGYSFSTRLQILLWGNKRGI